MYKKIICLSFVLALAVVANAFNGQAKEPINPADAASGIAPDIVLSWSAPNDVTDPNYDVYLGTDVAVRSNPKIASDIDVNSIDPSPDPNSGGTTYYWAVDVLDPNTAVHQGPTWSFTIRTERYFEDFESYVSDGALEAAWVPVYDGSSFPYVFRSYSGGPTGDYDLSRYHGGTQSMYFGYWNGDPGYWSGAQHTFTQNQNWTTEGVKALYLWFRGNNANNRDEIFVELEDSDTDAAKVYYNVGGTINTDPIVLPEWQALPFDLNEFVLINANLDLDSIKKITVGIGDGVDPGGVVKGGVHFDDFGLHMPKCIASRRTSPGDVGDDNDDTAEGPQDCITNYEDLYYIARDWLASEYWAYPTPPDDNELIAYLDFEGDFNDKSGNGFHGIPYGNAQIVTPGANDLGQGLLLDGNGDFVVLDGAPYDANFLPPEGFTVAFWMKYAEGGYDKDWIQFVSHWYSGSWKITSGWESAFSAINVQMTTDDGPPEGTGWDLYAITDPPELSITSHKYFIPFFPPCKDCY